MISFLQVLGLAFCTFVIRPISAESKISPSKVTTNNLTINVDDVLQELYLDGVHIDKLPNAQSWNLPDTVPLPDETKVIAVKASNIQRSAALIASDLGGWILSNGLWRYSTAYFSNWMDVDFDDRAWNWSYVAYQCNDGYDYWCCFPGISRHASLIWSPNFFDFDTADNVLYFRLKIDRHRLRRNFDLVATDEMVPNVYDCFASRRIQCAASCSQRTSLCSGFQHQQSTNTCCLLSAAQLQSISTTPSKGWNIWSSIVLNENCSC